MREYTRAGECGGWLVAGGNGVVVGLWDADESWCRWWWL